MRMNLNGEVKRLGCQHFVRFFQPVRNWFGPPYLKKMNSYRVLLAFMIGFGFLSITSYAQTVGEYRTAATGNWSSLTTWQRWNGLTWLTPILGEGYPGQ